MHRGDKAIATARQRLDKARLISMIRQRGSNLVNREIDAVLEINKRGFSPQSTLDFFASDDGSGTLRQEQEQAEGLWLKFYGDAGFAEFTRGRIQLEQAEVEIRRVGQAGGNCDHKLTQNVDCRGFYQLHKK